MDTGQLRGEFRAVRLQQSSRRLRRNCNDYSIESIGLRAR